MNSTISIDYLIINLKGTLTEQKHGLNIYKGTILNPFTLVANEYGNKTFKNVYELYHNDLKIGVLQSDPRSNIIPSDLIQLQFENHLFYTQSLNDLQQLIVKFSDFFSCQFESINRIDIAKDTVRNDSFYKNIYNDLVTGVLKVKGREKNIQGYHVTKQGLTTFTGFSIGKRASSRFLRVYNKSLALSDPKNPKTYINDFFQKNLKTVENVWRFEYQLNSSFFTYLRKINMPITFELFHYDTLIQLIELAEKNHFELVENTGKKEANKEKPFVLNNWTVLRQSVNAVKSYAVSRIKKAFEVTINMQKRVVKGLLRQYYISQETIFLYTLSKVVNEYNLKTWFSSKLDFYFNEFKNKEKYKNHFDVLAFNHNINQLIY